MALINRVVRLFKADFHAVLDRVEEPGMLLRQAIREMQDDLAADEQRQRVLQYELRHLQQSATGLQESQKNIDSELDICFAANKEDFARKLVRRKLELEQRLQGINQQQQKVQQQLNDMQAQIAKKNQQLEAMQQKAGFLLDTAEPAVSEFDAFAGNESGVQDVDVEVAFLKEQQRRSS